MLGANKRRRACYRHLRQRCHGGGGCVRPDERDPCSRRQLLFDHRHRQVTACLESQTSANFLSGNLDFRRWEGVNVMEPMKWALQALDIIESETRDMVPAGAPSTPKSETDVEIAPLVQSTTSPSPRWLTPR